MYADSIFRICIIASISLHLCLVLPWPIFNLLPKYEASARKIQATYFNESKALRAAAKDIIPQNPPKPAVRAEIKPNNDSTYKPSASPQNPPAVIPAKQDERKPIIKESSAKREENSAASIEEKRNEVEIIDMGTQKGAVYEKYYFHVRERIRSIIEKNRKGLLKESEACVRFILDRNGVLKDLYLYKSSGGDAGSLEKLAIKSIKEAAPFAPFTDKIKEDELQFNLPIRVIRKY